MRTLAVRASKTYDIYISDRLLGEAGDYLRKIVGGNIAAMVTDDLVDRLYSEIVEKSLANSGYRVVKFVIARGERSKNAENYLRLLDFLSVNKLSRSDVVVALGGGVVGDLAGFAASTYLRGVRLVQMPTTLLAAVDASVGGKTAINLKSGKNQAGTFYQPDLVLSDYSTFKTLEQAVFQDGCAEIIKYGMIASAELFGMLKEPLVLQLEEVIYRCLSIKRDIVAQDEQDCGQRQLLNFGHTVGHSIEACSNYSVTHGSAVAIGMVLITGAAVKLGYCSDDCLAEVSEMVTNFGLPTSSPYTAEQLFACAAADKKLRGENITLVMPEAIGKCVLKEIPLSELQHLIELGINSLEEV